MALRLRDILFLLLLSPCVAFADDYGTGADGPLTIASGTTTLAAEKNYTTLTINAGATLNTAGYTVRVRGLLSNAGTITATNGGAGGSGGAGGARYEAEGDGNTGTNGSAGTGTGGGGGGGGSSGAGQSHGGTNSYGGAGGAGGAGGKGGGTVTIYARYISNTGTIHADGSAGTNGTQGEAGDYDVFIDELSNDADMAGGGGGSGGGGGGGDGGTVSITTQARLSTGTVRAAGGAYGTGGAGQDVGHDCVHIEPNSTEYAGGATAGTGADNGGAGSTGGKGEEGAGAAGGSVPGTDGTAGSAGTVTWTFSSSADVLSFGAAF